MVAPAPCQTVGVTSRFDRLRTARLYYVCDRRAMARTLAPALAGGVDLFQLRDKAAGDDEVLSAAEEARALCAEHGALFVLNDRPDLAAAAGADGVHVGQEDAPVAVAREAVGADAIVGLSTHSIAQAEAGARSGADYIAVGPVHATPTKEGRPAIGLEPVHHAAVHCDLPWFAIGGIDASTISDVVAAGARRVVVVRAIAESDDPERAARGLREALGRRRERRRVGAA
jgi:thiamine-phosphate pyrophosphorylase